MNTNARILRFYWQHAWRYKWLTSSLFVFTIAAQLVFQFLPPLVIAGLLDKINRGQYTAGDVWGSFGADLLAYILLTFVGGTILWRIVIILIWELEMRVLRDLAQRVFGHLMLQSAQFHANRFGGSLVSQATKLGSGYVRLMDTTVFGLTGLLMAFVFTAVILAPRAPWVAVGFIGFSLVFMAGAVVITRQVRKLNILEAAANNKQTGALADAVTNVMAVKAFAGNQLERARFAAATEASRTATRNVMRASIKRDSFFAVTTGGLSIAALVAAVYGIVNFNADIGTMFLIVTYAGIIGQRLWDFSQSALRNINRSLGDAKEMVEILHLMPDVQDPAKPQPAAIRRGAIRFEAVSFRHADAHEDDSLFDNLNLTIKAGQKVGLVGHSGSGKSTLVKLLLRFGDIDDGRITIDGQDIATISQDDLHRAIAYVPQEPLLFHRSIRENIAYGRPGASDQQIREAARKAHADEFISSLPDGYDTLVGERGVKLSGGQRQRVAIARAILKQAPLLVLDEATSALDSHSERLIQDSLQDLMAERTSIVIAHRLSTIAKLDRIIVLENGAIVEDGSHQQLIKKPNGIYANLWSHQSGGFIED